MAFVGELADTICAFCFITSAGVRMAQDTSSAREEAVAWIMGWGIRPVGLLGEVGLRRERRDLVYS